MVLLYPAVRVIKNTVAKGFAASRNGIGSWSFPTGPVKSRCTAYACSNGHANAETWRLRALGTLGTTCIVASSGSWPRVAIFSIWQQKHSVKFVASVRWITNSVIPVTWTDSYDGLQGKNQIWKWIQQSRSSYSFFFSSNALGQKIYLHVEVNEIIHKNQQKMEAFSKIVNEISRQNFSDSNRGSPFYQELLYG